MNLYKWHFLIITVSLWLIYFILRDQDSAIAILASRTSKAGGIVANHEARLQAIENPADEKGDNVVSKPAVKKRAPRTRAPKHKVES